MTVVEREFMAGNRGSHASRARTASRIPDVTRSKSSGIGVAMSGGMPNIARLQQASSRPVILWVLRRDFDVITCGVDVNASGRCEVRTVPHRDPSLAVIEPFESAGEALQRHAEVAYRLRETGWVVAERVPTPALAA